MQAFDLYHAERFIVPIDSETQLGGPCQISSIELFCESSYKALVITSLCKKISS